MLRRKNSKNVREFSFGLVWYDPSSQDGSSLFNLAIPRILGRVTGLTQLRGGREEEEWREGGGEGGTGHMDSGAQQSAVRGPETLFSPKHTHVDPTRRRRGKCLENNVHRQVHLKSVRGHGSTGGSILGLRIRDVLHVIKPRSLCRLLLLCRGTGAHGSYALVTSSGIQVFLCAFAGRVRARSTCADGEIRVLSSFA